MALGQDPTYSQASKVYTKQQPAGTSLNGGTVTTEEVLDTGSLVNRFGLSAVNGKIQADQVAFAIAPGAANHSVVTITIGDNNGNAIPNQPFDVDVILSDAATGVGVTATAPSTSLTVTTGTQLNSYVANKALYVQSNGSAVIVINIFDTGKTGYFVMVQGVSLPFAYVSRQLVTGDYG
jgi:hypothetical protein